MLHSHPTLFSLLLSSALAAQTPPEPVPTPVPVPAPVGPPSLHAAFDQLLRVRVQNGLVDYAGFRGDDEKALQAYLDVLAKEDPKALPKPAQFVYYVNLYNAAMIKAVLEHTKKDPAWTPAAKDFAVFKEKRVRLPSGVVTLDHIENDLLRPTFKDYRVHVALVCGARSCPPLRDRAYESHDLEAVLDQNFAAFLRDTTRNQVDAATKTLRLSKLFEWFQADFGGEAGVRKLLEKHFDATVAKYKITYLEYSWDLNQQQPKAK